MLPGLAVARIPTGHDFHVVKTALAARGHAPALAQARGVLLRKIQQKLGLAVPESVTDASLPLS